MWKCGVLATGQPGKSPGKTDCFSNRIPEAATVRAQKDFANGGQTGWALDVQAEGIATHASILVWRIPMERGAWWATDHEVSKSQTRLSN